MSAPHTRQPENLSVIAVTKEISGLFCKEN